MKFPAFRTFSCGLGCEHMLARLLRVVLLGLILLGTGSARADVAELQYKRGIAYYEAKDYPRAIKAFQSAYKARQLPRILLNIGQVYRKLGMASTALKFYEHYLRVEPNPKPQIREEVDRYIVQTRAMLDPPDIVPLPSKSPAAAAAEAVASAPYEVSAVTVPELYEDSGRSLAPTALGKGKGVGKGASTARPLVPPSVTPPSRVTAPPTGITLYPVVPPPVANNVLVTPPPPVVKTEEDRPFYKKPWFWGVVGGVAGAAIITGVAVGVSRSESLPATILYPSK